MKAIKHLEENIHAEYCDAKKYIKLALKYKDSGEQDLAKMYHELAEGEIDDAKTLHDMAVKIIKAIPEDKKPSEGMLQAYEILHERDIEDANEVKRLMEMY